jgi:hypothetical protein
MSSCTKAFNVSSADKGMHFIDFGQLYPESPQTNGKFVLSVTVHTNNTHQEKVVQRNQLRRICVLVDIAQFFTCCHIVLSRTKRKTRHVCVSVSVCVFVCSCVRMCVRVRARAFMTALTR